VKDTSLRHNCIETFRKFNDSPLGAMICQPMNHEASLRTSEQLSVGFTWSLISFIHL